jgi:hypothetical protein
MIHLDAWWQRLVVAAAYFVALAFGTWATHGALTDFAAWGGLPLLVALAVAKVVEMATRRGTRDARHRN